MSDYLAVAGISAILKQTLIDALALNGPSSILDMATPVTVGPPDLVTTGTEELVQLNLFMYYASHNAAFRNLCLPSVDSQGNKLTNPPLALNLHYLISAYGKNEFDAEIILGWAMKVFHDNPIYNQNDINNLLAEMSGSSVPEVQLLIQTTLATQVESIKVTPESLSNEEIARLWMAFQTHYRTTTSYQVTVVLIQDTSTVKSNLPVQSRNVLALAQRPPVLKSISPANPAVGDMLTLTGSYFLGDKASDTMVQFDDVLPLVPAASVQDSCVRVKMPATLPAGVRSVRVVRRVSFGVSTDPHAGYSSNSLQFFFVPTITTAPPITAAVNTTLSLAVTPPVGREQQVALMVGDYAAPLPARPPTAPDFSSTLNFPIPADFPYRTPPAALPLRIQVDGAQSKLTLDQTTGSPTYGQFLPQATITP
ncbi:MAG TPA: Pvc16 family protein [Opitutaceae bacterium]|nr:Pvc16 family protein [Opitutaceae bacterium]